MLFCVLSKTGGKRALVSWPKLALGLAALRGPPALLSEPSHAHGSKVDGREPLGRRLASHLGGDPNFIEELRPRRVVPTSSPLKSRTTRENDQAKSRENKRWFHEHKIG